jgi:hypothetical protein
MGHQPKRNDEFERIVAGRASLPYLVKNSGFEGAFWSDDFRLDHYRRFQRGTRNFPPVTCTLHLVGARSKDTV